jgi:protein-tyrosine phosphatase
MIDQLHKGISILHRRLVVQGLYTTLLWAYGRGLPAITGKPILRFSQVTPQLYVGPQFRRNGLRMLADHGIRAVVNMRHEKDDAACGLAASHYCYLPTVDDQALNEDTLSRGIAFISAQIANGEKVYIHCGAGVGRAPSMAAAYLISTGKSLSEALQMIRAVRPFIYITPPQMTGLEAFEAKTRVSQA